MYAPRFKSRLKALAITIPLVSAVSSKESCSVSGRPEHSQSLIQSSSTKHRAVAATLADEHGIQAKTHQEHALPTRLEEVPGIVAPGPGPPTRLPSQGSRGNSSAGAAAPNEASAGLARLWAASVGRGNATAPAGLWRLARPRVMAAALQHRSALLTRGAVAAASWFGVLLPILLVICGLVVLLVINVGSASAKDKEGPMLEASGKWSSRAGTGVQSCIGSFKKGLPEEPLRKQSVASGAHGTSLMLPDMNPAHSVLSFGRNSPAASPAEPLQCGSYLCPGLVVPEDSECSLVVPRLEPSTVNQEATVDDASRVPVFRVVHCLPSRSEHSPASSGRQPMEENGRRCLVLSSAANDNTVFASCRLGLNGTLTILDNTEKPFGLIRGRVGKAGYEVATRAGSQIQLGKIEGGDLAVTDRRGRTMALTEALPGNHSCRMARIGPFVDAGLVTLAMLAVDVLDRAGM